MSELPNKSLKIQLICWERSSKSQSWDVWAKPERWQIAVVDLPKSVCSQKASYSNRKFLLKNMYQKKNNVKRYFLIKLKSLKKFNQRENIMKER